MVATIQPVIDPYILHDYVWSLPVHAMCLHRRVMSAYLRLANAAVEMQRWVEYDYVIVNDDLDESFRALKAILSAERIRRARRPGLADFVDSLLADARA